ncbi:transmembrane protein 234 [Malurus melanocephalus]|uniref:transmembrane protein 234 n=1 Tax=Malurus melanocephalus TaxID=175006 RepID=UPI0025496A49|nr:transmembrane protein 234 [Malurus melanocephalus]
MAAALRGVRESGTSGLERRKYVTVAMATEGTSVSLLLVAVLWGGTSPLLRAGAAGMEELRGRGRLRLLLAELRFLGLNCRVRAVLGSFLLLKVLIVLKSTGFLILGGTRKKHDDTVVYIKVTSCNSLALIVTLVTGKILGEDIGGKRAVAGMLLTILGVSLCVAAS